jgi:hypothetical protein
MENILKKIYQVKQEVGAISKDSKNPYFKSNYFDINSLLAEVEPVLLEYDLVLLQPIVDNKVTSMIFDIESGESMESSIELPNIADPQKLGSAITYFRRYTLVSLLGLQAEDDDGNKASNRTKTKKVVSTPKKTVSTPKKTTPKVENEESSNTGSDDDFLSTLNSFDNAMALVEWFNEQPERDKYIDEANARIAELS